jgi:hypothetical protein
VGFRLVGTRINQKRETENERGSIKTGHGLGGIDANNNQKRDTVGGRIHQNWTRYGSRREIINRLQSHNNHNRT